MAADVMVLHRALLIALKPNFASHQRRNLSGDEGPGKN